MEAVPHPDKPFVAEGGVQAEMEKKQAEEEEEEARTATAKGEKMRKKTLEYRDLFNLPALELVVQDYHAGLWRGLPYGWWQGRLVITTNHVLFRGTVGGFTRDIKMRSIDKVMKSRTLLLVDNGLEIHGTKGEKMFFGIPAPGHRDEALVLILHLLHHAVPLVDANVLRSEAIDKELSGSVSVPLLPMVRVAEVPILHKMSNDSLRFSRLIFSEESFQVQDGGGDENIMAWSKEDRAEFLYSQVSSIIVRSRPLHLDVNFRNFPRLRLCSSEIQLCVVELHARCPEAKVIFETGPMPRFIYDMPREKLVPRLMRERQATSQSFRDLNPASQWRYTVKTEKK